MNSHTTVRIVMFVTAVLIAAICCGAFSGMVSASAPPAYAASSATAVVPGNTPWG